MSVTIDSLDIQIRSSAGSAKQKIEELAKALDGLSGQENVKRIISALNKLPQPATEGAKAIKKLDNANKSAANSSNKLGKALNNQSLNFLAAYENLENVFGIMHSIQDAAAKVLNDAIQWDGIQFRFGRAFGEDAEMVLAHAEKISKELRINQQTFMQYSSLYGSLLSGFGMAQKQVTTISVGLTELSYDIWAAYNDRYKTLEDASEAVRSAITGEIEPIRNAGIALTEASMQEYIDNYTDLGVSVEKLTEAQKSELRYAVMVNSAMQQGIVGTYAREMQTAEGAIRTFSQQIKTLGQALGSLFLPILQKVVPWVTAFVELLTEGLIALGAMFGIEFQEISWGDPTGMKQTAEGANDTADALGTAAKNAKKMKDYVMGFDELNVISPPSDSSSGGAGAGAGGGSGLGLDLDTLWDDAVFASASKQIDEIKEKIKDLLPIVAGVGTAFAAWKIGSALMTALDTVKLALAGIAGKKGADSALTLLVSPKAVGAVEKLRGLLLKTSIGKLIMGSGATSVGAAAAAVAAVVAAVASLAAGFVIVFRDSENFRTGLATIGEGVAWVFDKIGDLVSWIGDKIGEFGKVAREKLSGIVPEGVLDFFDALELGVGDLLITLGGLALFGPWGLAIEGVVLAIKGIGYAASDALPDVDLFGEGISKATKDKVEPFLEKMSDLDSALKTLDWSNAIVTDGDLADISAKLKSVTDTIVNELDSDKNEALAKLNPLKGALSEEKYNELLGKIEESYNNQVQSVTDGENRINEILKKASEEARALTDEEAAEIAKIQENMKTTGIKYLSESETESNLILTRLKDNASLLSAEQASSVIKSAISARDETVKAAEEQYKGILLEAQRMLDTGTITKSEYDEIIAAAETTRDDTVKAAEKQYDDILKTAKTQMGEYSKYIDEETGEIKSNWNVFCDDVAAKWEESWAGIKRWWGENMAKFFTKQYWMDKFDSIKKGASEKLAEVKQIISDKWDEVKEWFSENVAPKLTKDYWMEKFANLKEGFTQTVKNMLNAGIDMLNKFIGWLNSKLSFSWSGLTIAGKEIFPGGSVQLFTIPQITQRFADGGFIEDGLFTMNRGEIAGRFNNGKSVVANNQQIVDGIAAGVYEAVVAAMSATNGNQGQNINVYLDGKQIYASVKKTESERGRPLMGNQLGYAY